ncbi:Com family DNA-binding transcriptional regulator [uncultured Desulfovibrio sp.]|uniref:Com family DNA-binding transcriptional regulator n=1 Tax=uncultured Desulfovibrio sp. TaxID=167968 RepID=UPI002624E860|nr:Com family DNA-binding transcriptional regulator [uncultured Desulfovibrio sp.]
MKTEHTDASAIRCGTCNKLLAKGHLEAGQIELLCPRCKTRILLRASSSRIAPQDGLHGDRHAYPNSRQSS